MDSNKRNIFIVNFCNILYSNFNHQNKMIRNLSLYYIICICLIVILLKVIACYQRSKNKWRWCQFSRIRRDIMLFWPLLPRDFFSATDFRSALIVLIENFVFFLKTFFLCFTKTFALAFSGINTFALYCT